MLIQRRYRRCAWPESGKAGGGYGEAALAIEDLTGGPAPHWNIHFILSTTATCLQLRNKWKSLTQRELNSAYEGPVFELADKCEGGGGGERHLDVVLCCSPNLSSPDFSTPPATNLCFLWL